jgi:hypothetical protein
MTGTPDDTPGTVLNGICTFESIVKENGQDLETPEIMYGAI